MKYIVILVLILFSAPANARVHIGTSLMVLGPDDITPSFPVGYSKFFKNKIVLDFTTNAFFPTRSEFNKRGFLVKSKVTYGAVSVGYKLDRAVLSGSAILVKVDNSIYYRNINIENYDNNALVFGINASYFFIENVAVSLFVLLPETKVDLKLSSGFGINYYF